MRSILSLISTTLPYKLDLAFCQSDAFFYISIKSSSLDFSLFLYSAT